MTSREITRKIKKEFIGAMIKRDSGKHILWEYLGNIVTVPKTPSDSRAWKNIRADFRRIERHILVN